MFNCASLHVNHLIRQLPIQQYSDKTKIREKWKNIQKECEVW